MNLQRLLPPASRVAALLPRPVAEAAADVLADLAWCLWPAGRRRLESALGAAAGPRGRGHSRGGFRTYARYYLSMQRLAHLPVTSALGVLRWHGREHLQHSLGAGHGVLVLTAHFGNWDAVGAGLAQCGWPPCVFAERLTPPALFDFYCRTRQRLGMTVAPAGNPGRTPHRTLGRNGVVALVADRPFGPRVERVPLGDGVLDVPAGGIRLALRTGAAIHGVFAVRAAAGFDLHCSPDWAAAARRDASADPARAVARAFAHGLGSMIRAYPDQWCRFDAPGADDGGARKESAA